MRMYKVELYLTDESGVYDKHPKDIIQYISRKLHTPTMYPAITNVKYTKEYDTSFVPDDSWETMEFFINNIDYTEQRRINNEIRY